MLKPELRQWFGPIVCCAEGFQRAAVWHTYQHTDTGTSLAANCSAVGLLGGVGGVDGSGEGARREGGLKNMCSEDQQGVGSLIKLTILIEISITDYRSDSLLHQSVCRGALKDKCTQKFSRSPSGEESGGLSVHRTFLELLSETARHCSPGPACRRRLVLKRKRNQPKTTSNHMKQLNQVNPSPLESGVSSSGSLRLGFGRTSRTEPLYVLLSPHLLQLTRRLRRRFAAKLQKRFLGQ